MHMGFCSLIKVAAEDISALQTLYQVAVVEMVTLLVLCCSL
jgi:hypothetical protein